jgi:hypothetical protein
LRAYIILSSNRTTGLSSLIADFSNPFASAGVDGRQNLETRDVRHPGMEALGVLCPERRVAPSVVLIVSGALRLARPTCSGSLPPD